jgi:cytidylate kinase
MIITLDGPSASGKSTIAQLLARDLSIMYLNTGLLYRAFAYCLVHECSYNTAMLAAPASNDIAFVVGSSFIRYDYDAQQGALLYYNNVNIAAELKKAEIDQWASIVSAHSGVREALLSMQRDLGVQRDLVVEGRDCGTVVFPHADHKFFITASLEARARRWQADQQARKKSISFKDAYASLHERDVRDSTRAVAPLIIPADAHTIDTTGMDASEVVALIKSHISKQ